MQPIHWCCSKENLSPASKAPKTISIGIGFFFFINSVVGVGFLGIPKVFREAGFLTALLTLLAISLLAWTTITWLVEAMARAQAIEDTKNQSVSECTRIPNFRLTTTRKFEQAEMCEIFVHKWLKYFYTLVISISLLSALLAYCTVAGQAWSINLPLHFGPFNACVNNTLFNNRYAPEDGGCLASYRFCVFLFAVIVIPLSLLDLKEQSIVQIALGLARFTLIGSMVLYCIVKMIQDACTPDSPSQSNCTRIDTYSLTTFDFKKWLAAIPVFLYAQSFHPSVAALSHPIKQKKQLGWFMLIVLLTTTFLYTILGTLISVWFGSTTLGTATLNWFPFTKPGNSIQLRMLSYLIILFPSLDVCTNYPLLVYTLVNNLFLIVMGRDTSQATHAYEWWIRLGMKAVIAVLPITCAMFVANLLSVLTYGGLITFFNVFFFPAVLQLASQRKCVKMFRKLHTKLDHGIEDKRTSLLENDGGKKISHLNDNEFEHKRLIEDTEGENTHFSVGEKADLLMNCGHPLYTTPYSIPGLSHPIAVVIIGFVGLALFTMAMTGAILN